MKLKLFSKLFFVGVAALNVLAAVAYLLSAFSPYVNPAEHKYLACMGLAFPVFALVQVGFVFVWAALRRAFVLVPIVTLLLGWGSLTDYFSLGSASEAGEGAVKVLTWNVGGKLFHPRLKSVDENPALRYVMESGADIVCLQEAYPGNGRRRHWADKVLAERYPYREYSRIAGGNGMTCLSRFPIVSAERIAYESAGNGSFLYRIRMGEDTVVVVNNHLESNRLSGDDKVEYRSVLSRSASKDSIEAVGKNLLHKLADAGQRRAPQADSVAKALRQSAARLTVVCGDFNDSPVSYAHRVISEGFDDAFVKGGFGIGVSYHDSRMYVRIDHILVSKAWRVTRCVVDNKMGESDHYPVWATLMHEP